MAGPTNGRDAEPGRNRPAGPRPSVSPSVRAYALAILLVAAMVAAYCLLPLDRLGPHHPVLSWTLCIAALAVIAALLLWQIRDIMIGRTTTRPGLVIPLLVCLSVLVFSAAYYALARQAGEMRGLHTRLDAVYFTLVTLSTIGYGDIAPIGQSARTVAVVQILYSFIFLTAATTALGRYARQRLGKQPDKSQGGQDQQDRP